MNDDVKLSDVLLLILFITYMFLLIMKPVLINPLFEQEEKAITNIDANGGA